MDTATNSKAEIASPIKDVDDEIQQLLQTLPKEEGLISGSGMSLYLYQGFWRSARYLKPAISFQTHFQAFDSDVMVATFPKCGTTWLKALTFSILYRSQFARDVHPLLNFTPHQLVRFMEFDVYLNNPCPDLDNIFCVYKPRLFATHLPHASLPTSIKNSKCKIVYICRNPMDMFVSLWNFTGKLRDKTQDPPLSLDEAFDKFYRGVYSAGPFFEHVLGYWKASQENPNKILFLKYEDLKEDISSQLKHLAIFLGVPFTEDEQKHGVVEEIANICSLKELKEVEVNKKGFHVTGIPHTDFFRKGEVGDWSNYLTPSMVERLDKLIHEKLDNSGLTFKLSS
ncbi:hypothetical protein V6N13_050408 [Hibiscus sabdariffa]|uniref:Sulfotransferase n=1 Tax=Hibiscus sabdariffa TaxID=183260 RepID=A0ABR2AX83_9ROSI